MARAPARNHPKPKPERRRAPRRKPGKKQPACDGGTAQADKADTLSALWHRYFPTNFRHYHPNPPSGRTGKRCLVSRPGHRAASQGGQNDGKEPGRIVAAGGGVGNAATRPPLVAPCSTRGLAALPSRGGEEKPDPGSSPGRRLRDGGFDPVPARTCLSARDPVSDIPFIVAPCLTRGWATSPPAGVRTTAPTNRPNRDYRPRSARTSIRAATS